MQWWMGCGKSGMEASAEDGYEKFAASRSIEHGEQRAAAE